MNDTKENTGWTTPTDTPAGWNPAEAERLAAFEQASRERSAAIRAQREAGAEHVEVFEERDVTDPSRVYTPLEPQERPQARENEAEGPEIAGGDEGASIEGAAGWEAQQGAIEAAETEAAAIQIEGEAEQTQAADMEREDPSQAQAEPEHQAEALSPEAAAALERIRAARALERENRDQELER
ncbi:hypothetical protein ACSDYK_004989 [Escherichia coli]|uniref:hypothetical protein n=1 Tax=Salmonella enterica TaxID=28901 RepID=UPI000B9F34AA|nr:hypothetical protein [Salmonella enterica]OXX94492.1 hypothetical protein P701_00050 [Salmonella enterica subsp. enterica serovar Newport str. CVM80_2288]